MCDSRVPIPWVHVYTMNPCQFHESMSIPWVLFNTKSPSPYHEAMSIPCSCQYHESISISWVSTKSPWQYQESKSIPWFQGVQGVPNGPRYPKGKSRSKVYDCTFYMWKLAIKLIFYGRQIMGDPYKNSNYRNTEIQITEIQNYKLKKCIKKIKGLQKYKWKFWIKGEYELWVSMN